MVDFDFTRALSYLELFHDAERFWAWRRLGARPILERVVEFVGFSNLVHPDFEGYDLVVCDQYVVLVEGDVGLDRAVLDLGDATKQLRLWVPELVGSYPDGYQYLAAARFDARWHAFCLCGANPILSEVQPYLDPFGPLGEMSGRILDVHAHVSEYYGMLGLDSPETRPLFIGPVDIQTYVSDVEKPFPEQADWLTYPAVDNGMLPKSFPHVHWAIETPGLVDVYTDARGVRCLVTPRGRWAFHVPPGDAIGDGALTFTPIAPSGGVVTGVGTRVLKYVGCAARLVGLEYGLLVDGASVADATVLTYSPYSGGTAKSVICEGGTRRARLHYDDVCLIPVGSKNHEVCGDGPLVVGRALRLEASVRCNIVTNCAVGPCEVVSGSLEQRESMVIMSCGCKTPPPFGYNPYDELDMDDPIFLEDVSDVSSGASTPELVYDGGTVATHVVGEPVYHVPQLRTSGLLSSGRGLAPDQDALRAALEQFIRRDLGEAGEPSEAVRMLTMLAGDDVVTMPIRAASVGIGTGSVVGGEPIHDELD